MPVQSQNPAGGIFQYLLKMNGSSQDVQRAQAALAASNPITFGIYQGLQLLPEGDLKNWLTANPIQFWKKIIQLFTGRKYTTGDYILGERYNDQILCNGDIGRSQVPDEMVPIAWQIFTILFGIRIRTTEDLDSLDQGSQAYYSRGSHTQDADPEAVDRAVFLKQYYYPISTYNRQCWDLKYFEMFPLVAPIPDPNVIGQLYTGPLPGGAMAVDGVIPVDAQTIIRQLPIPETGEPGNEFNPVPVDQSATVSHFFENAGIWISAHPIETVVIGGVVAFIVYELITDN